MVEKQPETNPADPMPETTDSVFTTHTVLVVEPDDASRDELRSILEKNRMAVITAGNAVGANRALGDNDVHLVLSEAVLPDADGIEWMQLVRSLENHRYVPFVFVSARKSLKLRLAAYNAGADGYIVKPCVAELLVARVAALADRYRAVTIDARRRVGELAGKLDTLSLEEVLQILERSRKTGVLVVEAFDGDIARVFWRDGEIHHAVYRRMEGPDALISLFAVREGRFYFLFGKPRIPRRTIRMQLPSLLLEGLRRLDEVRHKKLRKRFDAGDEKKSTPLSGQPDKIQDAVLRSARVSLPTVALLAGRLMSGKLTGKFEFCDIQKLSEMFKEEETRSLYTVHRRSENTANVAWLGKLDEIVSLLTIIAGPLEPDQVVQLLRSSVELTPVFTAEAPGGRLLRVAAVPFDELGHAGRLLSEVAGVIVMPPDGRWENPPWEGDAADWLERLRPRCLVAVGDETVVDNLKKIAERADIAPDIVPSRPEAEPDKKAVGFLLAKALSTTAANVET